mmetsp:Transcript_12378/g.31662  ORF Transcript_12378/g.31662 Transcript_12378/m.31662 type:complete len:229 (+) Transcript_12378:2294-2980(+)
MSKSVHMGSAAPGSWSRTIVMYPQLCSRSKSRKARRTQSSCDSLRHCASHPGLSLGISTDAAAPAAPSSSKPSSKGSLCSKSKSTGAASSLRGPCSLTGVDVSATPSSDSSTRPLCASTPSVSGASTAIPSSSTGSCTAAAGVSVVGWSATGLSKHSAGRGKGKKTFAVSSNREYPCTSTAECVSISFSVSKRQLVDTTCVSLEFAVIMTVSNPTNMSGTSQSRVPVT